MEEIPFSAYLERFHFLNLAKHELGRKICVRRESKKVLALAETHNKIGYLSLVKWNKTGTSNVGAIPKAQKAQFSKYAQ